MPPRRSTRQSLVSSTASQRSTKRPASSPKESEVSKLPRRAKVANATPTKSAYFKRKLESDPDEEEDSSLSSVKAESDDQGSEYGWKSESNASDTGEDELDREESEEDNATKSRKARSKKQSTTSTNRTFNDGGLWRAGAKTGLRPGTQIVIKKPKARDPGDVPYTDSTIHPNTMLFLADLLRNNDRQWLKMHDPDYRTSLQDWTSFVEALTHKVAELDETIPELPVKDVVFKIYRDVRFSKDPTPYKPYFSAAWSRTGRKGPYAAYYVQIKPDGGSYVGGGLWMPEAQPLAALRRDIDRRPHKLKMVLRDQRIRRAFFDDAEDDEEKVVRAFTKQNAENALKTKPKDYDKDHKDIELLRLRNYTLGKRLPDEAVLGEKGFENVAELISCLVPFITHLNSVVMPDEPDESPSEENDDDEDGDDDETHTPGEEDEEASGTDDADEEE